MEQYLTNMIVEHSALEERYNKLADFLTTEKSDKITKEELIQMGAQMSAMLQYLEALENRLGIHGVNKENGYYTKVVTTEDMNIDFRTPIGSDFDKDKNSVK